LPVSPVESPAIFAIAACRGERGIREATAAVAVAFNNCLREYILGKLLAWSSRKSLSRGFLSHIIHSVYKMPDFK
jgi:hypothetical protein